MGKTIHETVPVLVWADVDIGIAKAVRRLNEIADVRTHASCQGTIGEGGAQPYPPHVMVSWRSPEAFEKIKAALQLPNPNELDMAVCKAASRARPGT